MRTEIKHTDPSDLIPWFVNGSLDADETKIVETWLTESPFANNQLEIWKMIQATVRTQKILTPPASIWNSLIEDVNETRKRSIIIWQKWIFTGVGIGLAILVFITLWGFVQPGVRLQWSVRGQAPVAFRIYRAPTDSDEFTLIRELKSRGELLDYQFIDTLVIPGSGYTYRVEAVDDMGSVGYSQVIIRDTIDALPLQIVILLTSVIFGVSTYMVINILEPILKFSLSAMIA